jgi:hypothetical protein
MVRLKFSSIPEGVPYELADRVRELEGDTPDDVVRLLNLQAARSALADNDMAELIYTTLASRIVDGHRYGHHLVKIGEYVPQIVEWALAESAGSSASPRVAN